MGKKESCCNRGGDCHASRIGVEKSWEGLIEGRSGVRRLTHFDSSAFATQIAGEIEGFNPEDYIEPKEVKKMGPFYPSRYYSFRIWR